MTAATAAAPVGAAAAAAAVKARAASAADGEDATTTALAAGEAAAADVPSTAPFRGTPFRVSCIRSGRHEFSSVDVAAAVADTPLRALGMRVDLNHFDLEVVCLLFQTEVAVAILLAPETKGPAMGRLPYVIAMCV